MFNLNTFFMKIKKMFSLYSEEDFVPDVICNDCGSMTIIDLVGKNWDTKNNCFCYSCGNLQFRKKPSFTKNSWENLINSRNYYEFSSLIPFGSGVSKTPTDGNYIVISSQDYNTVPQLTVIAGEKAEKVIEPNLNSPVIGVYPEDYYECKVCGYDHKYDSSLAERKHSKLQ